MKICIAGTGDVGLVTGVCLAEAGHDVTCIDIDENRVESLKAGISAIFEADLDRLMKKNYEAGRIEYTTDYRTAYRIADAIFIGVGTPQMSDGSTDNSFINTAARQIAESIEKDCLVVVKSSAPVGTGDNVEQLVRRFLIHNVMVEVASNPEFLTRGSAVHDTLHADRIVIGVESEWADKILREIFEPFHSSIISVNRRTAEIVKLASSDFLALKTSYMCEIANLCELVQADVSDVARVMSYDERIGKFMDAGIGFGGYRFYEDTKSLVYLAGQNGYEIKTIKAAIDVNEEQRLMLYRKAVRRLGTLSGLKVAVLGLTFKPGTDDIREAPSLYNIPLMLENGADIHAYDPVGIDNIKNLYPQGHIGRGSITYVEEPEEALNDADLCLIFTEWGKIRAIEPATYRIFMKTPLIYDGRNVYDVKLMEDEGVEYHSIGRKQPSSRTSHVLAVN